MAALAPLTSLLRRWGGRSLLSVADQAAFSGANFLLAVLLARWLSPDQYGTYAVAFSLFLFLAGFHNALVLEPMSVLGPTRHHLAIPRYLALLLWIHLAFGACASLLLLLASLVTGAVGSPLAGPLSGMSAATPFILLFWLLRSACYVRTRPGLALQGSLLYAALLVGLLFLVHRAGALSPSAAFLIMGFSGAFSALLLGISHRIGVHALSLRGAAPELHGVLAENWKYGKWVTGSAFVYWLGTTVYMPFIGALGGLPQAAAYQALQNLFRPLQQSLAALSLLFLPAVSGRRIGRGDGFVRKSITLFTSLCVLVSIAYCTLLVVFRDWLIRFLYGGESYGAFSGLLAYLGVATLIAAGTQGAVMGLKSLRRTRDLFLAQAAGAVLTLTLGFLLVWSLKIQGAALGSILTGAAVASVSFLFLRRRFAGVACR